MPLLTVFELKKSYRTPEGGIHQVVDVPSFELPEKQQLALSGASGTGKTTFLNLIAGIVPADAGQIKIGSAEITKMSEGARDRVRATELGYIFQTFNLLQGFTCLENVVLGMSFGRVPLRGKQNRAFAESLLERVGLKDRMSHFPRQLSTGQQQRVAVARALANQPRLVLADEPTGNLDPTNAREALALIRESCEEKGAALLLVSHDPEILGQFERRQDLKELNKASRQEETA